MERKRYLICVVIAAIIGIAIFGCYMIFGGGTFAEPQSEAQVYNVVPTAGAVRCICGGTMTDYSRAATCTETGFEGLRCGSCGREVGTTSPALGHNAVTDEAVAATCTTTGLTEGSHCGRCGTELESQEIISALGHSYGSYVVTKSATCTSTGTKTATCSRCNAKTTQTIAALGHSYSSTKYSATCTSQGYTRYRCSRCSYSYTSNYTSALGHNYGSYVQTKAPTCTAKGTETATCSRCSATTSRDISALGHSAVTDNAVAATCTTSGLTEGSHCSRCNTVLEEQETVLALGHNYGSYVQTKAPTCTEKGTETATCSRCSATTNRDISALGHNAVTDEAVAATCTTTGLTEGSHCSRCNEILLAQETIPALWHNYGSYVQTKAPTCTAKGTETATCSRCSATTSRDIEALGHEAVTDEAVPASCTETGLTEGSHCSRCNEILLVQEIVPALGHDWSDWEDSRTSCDEVGTRTRSCSVCGEEEIEELSAGTHTWDNGTVTKQPDCTQPGTMQFTCTVCGDTFTEDIAPLGHTEVSVESVPATCTEEGLTSGSKCSVCGAVVTEQQIIPAFGHELIHTEAVEPTEDSDGNIEYWQCDRCGKYFSDEDGDIEIDISEVAVTYSGGRSLWQVILAAVAGAILFVVIAAIISKAVRHKKS